MALADFAGTYGLLEAAGIVENARSTSASGG